MIACGLLTRRLHTASIQTSKPHTSSETAPPKCHASNLLLCWQVGTGVGWHRPITIALSWGFPIHICLNRASPATAQPRTYVPVSAAASYALPHVSTHSQSASCAALTACTACVHHPTLIDNAAAPCMHATTTNHTDVVFTAGQRSAGRQGSWCWLQTPSSGIQPQSMSRQGRQAPTETSSMGTHQIWRPQMLPVLANPRKQRPGRKHGMSAGL